MWFTPPADPSFCWVVTCTTPCLLEESLPKGYLSTVVAWVVEASACEGWLPSKGLQVKGRLGSEAYELNLSMTEFCGSPARLALASGLPTGKWSKSKTLVNLYVFFLQRSDLLGSQSWSSMESPKSVAGIRLPKTHMH